MRKGIPGRRESETEIRQSMEENNSCCVQQQKETLKQRHLKQQQNCNWRWRRSCRRILLFFLLTSLAEGNSLLFPFFYYKNSTHLSLASQMPRAKDRCCCCCFCCCWVTHPLVNIKKHKKQQQTKSLHLCSAMKMRLGKWWRKVEWVSEWEHHCLVGANTNRKTKAGKVQLIERERAEKP